MILSDWSVQGKVSDDVPAAYCSCMDQNVLTLTSNDIDDIICILNYIYIWFYDDSVDGLVVVISGSQWKFKASWTSWRYLILHCISCSALNNTFFTSFLQTNPCGFCSDHSGHLLLGFLRCEFHRLRVGDLSCRLQYILIYTYIYIYININYI